MKSSRSSDAPKNFGISVTDEVDQAVDREVARWEERGQGPSQLRDELEAASKTLAQFPYAGQRSRGLYRLQLGRTQFVIEYKVYEQRELVELIALVHGKPRRPRRVR